MATYGDHVRYWDDVYGFKMSCMRTTLLEEASVNYVLPEVVMSEPAMIKVCHSKMMLSYFTVQPLILMHNLVISYYQICCLECRYEVTPLE